MLDSAAYSGLYGKIPAVGDFVSSRSPPDFVEAWDSWLQSGMNHWRLAAGGDWTERFDASAGFQFAFDAGVCGAAPVIGVVAASWDRVGRRFPLTIAATLPSGTSALVTATCAQVWCEGAAQVLRTIRQPGFESPTQLESLLQRLDAPLAEIVNFASRADTMSAAAMLQGAACHVAGAAGHGLTQLLASLCARHIAANALRLSWVWSAEPPVNLWSCAGMPTVESFASLFAAGAPVPVPSILRQAAAAQELRPMAMASPAPMPSTAAVPSAGPMASAAPLSSPVPLSSNPPPTLSSTSPIPAPASNLRPATGAELRTEVHLLVAVANVAYVAFGTNVNEPADQAAIARRFRSEFSRSGSAPGACQATLGGAAASCAAWLPDEEGGEYVWCGTATIFRLRGTDLERLAGEEPEDSGTGDSLADLLGGSDTGVMAAPALTSRQAADVRAGDRILLCADGSYGRLSWAQLVSALREEQPGLAARRLQEAWTQPAASVPGAIVIAFDSEADALVATHATVAKPAAAVA